MPKAARLSKWTYFMHNICIWKKVVLDRFNWHYQASFHFPLTSDVDKSQQHPNKLFGNAKNQTWGSWARSKNATSVLGCPPWIRSLRMSRMPKAAKLPKWTHFKPNICILVEEKQSSYFFPSNVLWEQLNRNKHLSLVSKYNELHRLKCVWEGAWASASERERREKASMWLRES